MFIQGNKIFRQARLGLLRFSASHPKTEEHQQCRKINRPHQAGAIRCRDLETVSVRWQSDSNGPDEAPDVRMARKRFR